jgi:hypothetical protein
MRNLPPPGDYTARRTAPMVVQEAESGALLLWIAYVLCSGEIAHTGKHMICLGTKEGELQLKAIESLKKAWPDWDSSDLYALQDIPFKEGEEAEAPEFELADCYHDNSYTPRDATEPVVQFKARWFNALGGTQNMPAPADESEKKKIQAKWGTKFKAAAGGKAAVKPAAKPAASKPAAQAELAPAAAAPKAAPKVAGPPSRKPAMPAPKAAARVSSQQEVWEAYYTAQGGTEETAEALGDQLYAAAEEIAPGIEVGEITPEQWGAVAVKLGV